MPAPLRPSAPPLNDRLFPTLTDAHIARVAAHGRRRPVVRGDVLVEGLLDDNGFIKTGPELSRDDPASAGWPLTRPPYLLETSRPGVFAVGDVRGGNIKRVALLWARVNRSGMCSSGTSAVINVVRR